VLGSKGRTLVSGPELEARLGLYSTWAYFSVKNPKGTRAEPDASGQSPTPTPNAQPANVGGTVGSAAAATTPSSKPAGVDGQGGVPAG
jgi:hypothetical protein